MTPPPTLPSLRELEEYAGGGPALYLALQEPDICVWNPVYGMG